MRWRSFAASDTIKVTDSLTQTVKWGKVKTTPQVDGEWKTTRLSAAGAAQYCRVR